jgi:hypothetical protein
VYNAPRGFTSQIGSLMRNVSIYRTRGMGTRF